jgi:hypothetical protein
MKRKRKVCKRLQKGKGWTEDEHEFLRENFFRMTNRELTDYINASRSVEGRLTVSGVRAECSALGLTRGTQIRWSEMDIEKLRVWYPLMGDTEIAVLLNKTNTTYRIIDGKKIYRKFTTKHVEKKRFLMGWHRTSEQIKRITDDNNLVNKKETSRRSNRMWEIRGVKPEGAKVIWEGRRYIKINGRFVPYARWFYQNKVRKLRDDEIVYHQDGNRLNDDLSNLVVISRAALAQKNVKYYPPEIREAIKTLNLLTKTIKEHEKQDY